jgi:hypothetical protein
LRIAAIATAHHLTLLFRNVADSSWPDYWSPEAVAIQWTAANSVRLSRGST